MSFIHLPAATPAINPVVEGGHRVVLLSSDDEDGIAPVANSASHLGFAPRRAGKLNEGGGLVGALMSARGQSWGRPPSRFLQARTVIDD